MRIDAIRDEGSYNDGYIDNVSLAGSERAAPVFHKTRRGQGRERQGPHPPAGQLAGRRPQGSDGIPLGSTVDAQHGSRRCSALAAPRRAAPQTAKFYEGVFKVTQTGGTTKLALTRTAGRHVARAARRGRGREEEASKRHLWGDGKGAFRTSGKYSSATVRGTKWLVQDSCAGTLTRVVRGTVKVRDNVRHKTITVAAGKSYLAKPRR